MAASMRSLENEPSFREHREQIQVERDLCLRSLLSQAVGKAHGSYDVVADKHLIEGLNEAVVADMGDGTYELACQEGSCGAECVMVIRTSGQNGTLEVSDPSGLEDCIYEVRPSTIE